MCDRRKANIWTARFMPVMLTGMAGYTTYVFVIRLCIKYLLNPPLIDTILPNTTNIPIIVEKTNTPTPRTATAIGLIVGYLIFLIFMGSAYFRLVFTVLTNPGFTPLGPSAYGTSGEGKEAWTAPVSSGSTNEKGGAPPSANSDSRLTGSPQAAPVTNGSFTPNTGFQALSSRPAGQQPTALRQPLTQVFLRDIFLCDSNGEVRWCGRCGNYKPDRTHHCSEVGRCVENFDHFCPWVGGVVGLTSYKFFFQFVGYGTLYCVYTLICMAIFFQEKVSRYGFQQNDGHWVAIIAMGGFFGLFILGMFITNMQMIYWGSTTIENFDRKTKRYYVARLDPNQDLEPGRRTTTLNPRTTTRAPQQRPFWQKDDGTRDEDSGFHRRLLLPLSTPRRMASPIRSPTSPTSPVTSPVLAPSSPNLQPKVESEQPFATPRRYYKIYLTPPGLHPWRIGFKRNFKQVMGPRVWDWLLPMYRPYQRPRSGDSDGELAEGIWSANELSKQLSAEGWASASQGAAMARDGGINRWYEFSEDFIGFLDSCDQEELQQ
ncbi:palmitoyltransferase pfa5 [Orbilia oligospora]|uniref:Palmitoyltransferase n=1 Tax=Orbilia oligospora TaxID=2813651 RepID=A0A7C8JMU7_ORBOL|nr:palmitoyltransferase pfa5 [Orbilia oligospora]